jgi:hypothetical protein
LLRTRKWASRGLEEEEAFVIGPHGAEDAFACPAFRGAGMQPKLGGDLGGGQPPGVPEILGQARNPISVPDVPDHQAMEWLPGARAEPAPVQCGRDLPIGLLRGQHMASAYGVDIPEQRKSESHIRPVERMLERLLAEGLGMRYRWRDPYRT